jgi:GntR family transcriptional regulator
MEFRQPQAIYLQIGDYICDQILRRNWSANDRIPSIRELAVEVEVNPNTVTRTYAYLQERGIISNRRGIGYFVTDQGYEQVRELKRRDFVQRELPQLFRTLDVLGMTLDDLQPAYSDHGRAKVEN